MADSAEGKHKIIPKVIEITQFLEDRYPDVMILLDEDFKLEHEIPGFIAVKWDAPISEIITFIEENMHSEYERRLNVKNIFQ